MHTARSSPKPRGTLPRWRCWQPKCPHRAVLRRQLVHRPTIGVLFLWNFLATIVIAVGLVAPLRRATGRCTDAVRAVVAVGGIGLGVLSLAGPFVSESSGLFGFVEHGYRMAIVFAIAVEIAAPYSSSLRARQRHRLQKIRTSRDEPREETFVPVLCDSVSGPRGRL
jgi:hypothetical protein